jgi:hypothetical protein
MHLVCYRAEPAIPRQAQSKQGLFLTDAVEELGLVGGVSVIPSFS